MSHPAPGGGADGKDRLGINAAWVVRLRFGAVAGQIVTILLVRSVMGVSLPLPALLSLIGLELLSNVALALQLRRPLPLPRMALPAAMVLDVLLLSGLLYLTGGPLNPFSFLYLVHIALSAVVLEARWTWALVLLSVACSAVLFLRHRPLDLPGSHGEHMAVHLRGMWFAFAVAASFIVYFLLRVTAALERREVELQAARHLAARKERLASLATLAAGAAHELATPLSTIALVAKEMERREGGAAPDRPANLEDVRLIRQQVERCRAVLTQLGASAGQSAGEDIQAAALGALIAAALDGLPAQQVRVELKGDAAGLVLRLPLRALSQALRGIIKNALDASQPGEAPIIEVDTAGPLRIVVRDRGTGISDEVMARIGEPFFTTKPPGAGMGLGVFLCRAVLDSLGGRLELRSVPGAGTEAALVVPLSGTVTICRIAEAGRP